MIGAYHEAYGLQLAPLLSAAGIADVEWLIADQPVWIIADPFRRYPNLSALLRLARLNSPSPPPAGLPVLLLVGGDDTVAPTAPDVAFARAATRAGANLRLQVVPGADHNQTLIQSTGAISAFLGERLAN